MATDWDLFLDTKPAGSHHFIVPLCYPKSRKHLCGIPYEAFLLHDNA